MKKTYLLALYLSLGLLLLTACGGAPETPTPSAIPTAAAPTALAAPAGDGTFRPVTVLDNAGCLIRVTGVDPKAKAGYTVKTQLTNRGKKPVLFSLRHAAVNGVQTDPLFGSEVPAGETVETDMVFDSAALKAYDITEFTDIELNFLAVDAADLSLELDNNTPVHLYPDGPEKAKRYVRDEKDDRLIFENDYMKASLISYYQDRKTGFAANLHLENKTDLPLNFTVDDAALNRRACDPSFFVTVAPEKQLFTSLYWSPSFLAECGVDTLFLAQGDTDEPAEEIEELRFTLRVYDATGRTQYDFVDEEITLLLPEEEPEPSPSPVPVSPAPAG